ncbi:MAG: siphovirus Gp157 family protein [Polaromonas sp.]|nr:siphovirus Gp157 family protein [Polaromonas sp.]
MSTALFVLTNQYLELAEKLSGLDLDAQTIQDTIEASGITDELTVKAQGIEHVAREAEKYNTLIDMEIERLQALKASRDKVAAGLRAYLKLNMERAGIEKIECPLFAISIKRNPPAVEIIDSLSLPLAYWRTPEPKPPVAVHDKAAIKAALQAGIEVMGARMIQGTRLDVR